MTGEGPPEDLAITTAERVSASLAHLGTPSCLIGAGALAVHGYPRATADLDLATSADPRILDDLARLLRADGYAPVVRGPDAEDPLGGVLDLRVDADTLVQVVNFLNPFSTGGAWRLAREAIDDAEAGLIEGCELTVVRPGHLIALKLYGGGLKNRSDVGELLSRRPELLAEAQAVCARFGLLEPLERIVAELPPGRA